MILNNNDVINLDLCEVLIGMIMYTCFSSTLSMSFWAVFAYTDCEAIVKVVRRVCFDFCKWKFTFRPSSDASIRPATKKEKKNN